MLREVNMTQVILAVLLVLAFVDRHYHVCLRSRLEKQEALIVELHDEVARLSSLTSGLRNQLILELEALTDYTQEAIEKAGTVRTVAPDVKPGRVALAAGALTLSPEVHWETLDEILSRKDKR